MSEYAQLLIETYEKQLEDFYDTGARKIALFGLIWVGCMPYKVQKHPDELDDTFCVSKLNSNVTIFNDKLQKLVEKLNDKHHDAAFTYINSYEIDSEDLTNEGFKYNHTSCCNVPKSGDVACEPLSCPCDNRSEYVYWDRAHFTEAKAREFGKRAYKRQTLNDANPYDIFELVQLKLDNSDAYDITHAHI